MYCTLRTVVHFTWEICALAVPLKLVQLGIQVPLCVHVRVVLTCLCVCICYTTPVRHLSRGLKIALYPEWGWYNEFIFCFGPNCVCTPDVAHCVVAAVWWLVDQLFFLCIKQIM